MKKFMTVILAMILALSAFSVPSVSAAPTPPVDTTRLLIALLSGTSPTVVDNASENQLLVKTSSLAAAPTFATIDVPGAGSTFANGLNNRGQVVGFYRVGGQSDASHGFLLDEGNFTTVDVPGAFSTQAFGINDRGQIVGDYIDAQGFLLDKGTFKTVDDVPGASETEARTINERGQIVGFHNAGGNFHGFFLR